jgi:hypothetical protein
VGKDCQDNLASGKRDEMVEILRSSAHGMPGCLSYIVAKDSADENVVDKTRPDDPRAIPHFRDPPPESINLYGSGPVQPIPRLRVREQHPFPYDGNQETSTPRSIRSSIPPKTGTSGDSARDKAKGKDWRNSFSFSVRSRRPFG